MALANRLVGNGLDAGSLEVTFGPAAFRFSSPVQVAVTGARCAVSVNGSPALMHRTLRLDPGSELRVGAAETGARAYISVSGGIRGEAFLGSISTYLPATFGGHEGRSLRKGDEIGFGEGEEVQPVETPSELVLWPTHAFALRAVPGPDWSAASSIAPDGLFHATARASRMGIELSGALPTFESSGLRASAAVFPGALQVTPSGHGFLLLADGQTTGGYPHLLQVIRADRHLLGQIRPRDSIRFLIETQEQAEQALKAKQALLERWLPGFRL